MKYEFVALLVVLCVSVCWGVTEGMSSEDIAWFGVLNMVDKCEFVAIGTVELMTAQYYTNVLANRSDFIMTDVLVRIDTLIKGSANTGDDHIKFAVHGGVAYNPNTGSEELHEISSPIKFEVGEKVMLFLRNGNDSIYHSNFPHGRHRVHMWDYGKRLVKNNKVSFKYEKEGEAKDISLSLDLAKEMAKAYGEDKDATILLENQIKTVVTNGLTELSDAKTAELKNSAKRIAGGK